MPKSKTASFSNFPSEKQICTTPSRSSLRWTRIQPIGNPHTRTRANGGLAHAVIHLFSGCLSSLTAAALL
jgi:hypothetical protein